MNPPQKYALVTGASSGIGWHMSLELVFNAICHVQHYQELANQNLKYL